VIFLHEILLEKTKKRRSALINPTFKYSGHRIDQGTRRLTFNISKCRGWRRYGRRLIRGQHAGNLLPQLAKLVSDLPQRFERGHITPCTIRIAPSLRGTPLKRTRIFLCPISFLLRGSGLRLQGPCALFGLLGIALSLLRLQLPPRCRTRALRTRNHRDDLM